MDVGFLLIQLYRLDGLLFDSLNRQQNHDNNFYLLIAGYRRSTQEDCIRNKNVPLRPSSLELRGDYVRDTLLLSQSMFY